MFSQLVMNTIAFPLHCVSMLLNNSIELSFFSEVPTKAYKDSSKCNQHPSPPPHYSAKIKTHHAVNRHDNWKYTKVHVILQRSPTEQTKTKNTWTTTGTILESKHHLNFSDRVPCASKLTSLVALQLAHSLLILPFQSTIALFPLHLHVIADSWSRENNLSAMPLGSRTASSP